MNAIALYKLVLRDSVVYFLALEETKKGTYKGLQVEHDNYKRKPGKAVTRFIAKPRPGEIGYKEISPSDLPEAVQKRFAEVMSP